MNIQPSGNQKVNTFTLVGSPETGRQLPGNEDYPIRNLNAGSIKPWFITGFVDAEGLFGINIRKTSTHLG